jgi:hypothetical protein
MANIVFPSLENSNFRYVLDGSHYYDRFDRQQGAVEAARWYDTMGDGNTQHTPLMAVSDSMLADFCFSLCAHLRENPADLADVAKQIYLPEISRKQIDFFTALKYTEGKPRYFSRSELKVSSSDSKRHDKRWEEIPSWSQGRLKDVFGFWLNGRREDTFTRVSAMIEISEITEQYILVEREFSLPTRTEGAVIALRCLLQAAQLQTRSNSILDNYFSRQDKQAA